MKFFETGFFLVFAPAMPEILPDMEEKNTWLRWVFAIGCFGVSFSLVKDGYVNVNATRLLTGLLFFVIGIGSILTSLIRIATRPLTFVIDSIFFPGGRLRKPVKNLKLPRYYEKEFRFDDALLEYEKIIRYYPDEVAAYEGAIRLLIREFDDYPAAEKLFTKSRRRHLVLDDEVADWFPGNRP